MSLSTSRFTKRNEWFLCGTCGQQVPPASRTCRDHCPYCLHSMHVDVFPGDRAATCHGVLTPVGYETHAKKGYVILYKCSLCGEKKKNKFLEHDALVSDDFSVLLKLGHPL